MKLSSATLVLLIAGLVRGEISDGGLPNLGVASPGNGDSGFANSPFSSGQQNFESLFATNRARQTSARSQAQQRRGTVPYDVARQDAGSEDGAKQDSDFVVFSIDDLFKEPPSVEKSKEVEDSARRAQTNINHSNQKSADDSKAVLPPTLPNQNEQVGMIRSGEQGSEQSIQDYFGLDKHKEKAAEVAQIFSDDFLKQILKRTSFSIGHVKPKMTTHPKDKVQPNKTDAAKANTSTKKEFSLSVNESVTKDDGFTSKTSSQEGNSYESTIDIQMHFKTKQISTSGANRESKDIKSSIEDGLPESAAKVVQSPKIIDMKLLPRIRTQQTELMQQCTSDCFTSGQIFLSKNVVWSDRLKDRTSDEYGYLSKVLRGQITQLLIDSYPGKHLDEVIVDTLVPYDSGILADIFVSFKDLGIAISDRDLAKIFNSGLVDSFLGPYHIDPTLTFFRVMSTQQAKAVFQRPFDVDIQAVLDQEERNESHTQLALIGVGAICFAIPFVALSVFWARKCKQARVRDASKKLADLERARIRVELDSAVLDNRMSTGRSRSAFGSQVALNSSLPARYSSHTRLSRQQQQHYGRRHPRTSSTTSSSGKRMSLPNDNRRVVSSHSQYYRPASRNGSLSSLSYREWPILEMDETMDDMDGMNNTTYETISDMNSDRRFRRYSDADIFRHRQLIDTDLNDDVNTNKKVRLDPDEHLIEFSGSSDESEKKFQQNDAREKAIQPTYAKIKRKDGRFQANEDNTIVNIDDEQPEMAAAGKRHDVNDAREKRYHPFDINVIINDDGERRLHSNDVPVESNAAKQVAFTVDSCTAN